MQGACHFLDVRGGWGCMDERLCYMLVYSICDEYTCCVHAPLMDYTHAGIYCVYMSYGPFMDQGSIFRPINL